MTPAIYHISLDSKDKNYNINDSSHALILQIDFSSEKEEGHKFKDTGETDVIYSGENAWLTTEEK